MILSIHWAVDSQLIDGWRTPNLYGLLFVSGIVMGYFVIRKMFRAEQVEDKVLDTLVTYMVLATIVGARLGHVLFYGPYWDKIEHGQVVETGYFSHPGEIIKIWEGGLASHGAAIAILIALYIFTKKVSNRSYIWILDRIATPIAIAATFIRLGNLVNHEMVGYVTDVPWAFEFAYFYNEAIGNYDPYSTPSSAVVRGHLLFHFIWHLALPLLETQKMAATRLCLWQLSDPDFWFAHHLRIFQTGPNRARLHLCTQYGPNAKHSVGDCRDLSNG